MRGRRSSLLDAQGVTLLELLVVAALVGILASIAIPNYLKHRQRTMHAQAKLALSSLYVLEKSFAIEYNSYTTRLNALGFSIEGATYFDVGFETDYSPPAPAPQGTPGCTQICEHKAFCGSQPSLICTPMAGWGLDGGNYSTASASAFVAEAHSHLKGTAGEPVTWLLNELRVFRYLDPGN
jgi:prepilin-type N-terminal cleavage/methylation domain-containing protein